MSFLQNILSSLSEKEQSTPRSQDRNATIKCDVCGSREIQRPDRETIVCTSCGKQYTLDEARKKWEQQIAGIASIIVLICIAGALKKTV